MRQRMLVLACAAVLMAVGWGLFGPARHADALPTGGFVAPLPRPLTVLQGFDPPTQRWLPGNRGVDLAATTGEPVVAVADGVVLYAGLLAGRGVVSINHGDVRTTYEPVDPIIARGVAVRRGEVVAHVSAAADGCGPPGGCLHWGAIRGDAYIDPLGLLAGPRVRLLPVWTHGLPASVPRTSVTAASSATPSSATPSSATPSSATPSATTGLAHLGVVPPAVAAAGAAMTSVGLAAAIAGRRRARAQARAQARARASSTRKPPAS